MIRTVNIAIAALLVACTPGGAKSAPPAVAGAVEAGGKMSEGVRRLEGLRPGRTDEGGWLEIVDRTPIVLWAGDEPAAVLAYRLRQERQTIVSVEEIAAFPESVPERLRGGRGFPLVLKSTREERADRFAMDGLIVADVDGDGVDELVACRELGGVEVVGLKAPLAHYPGPSKKTETASYRMVRWQKAEVKGRAVVHLLLERVVRDPDAEAKELARIGAPDPYAVLRVDARGVTAVPLSGPGWPAKAVLAIAAINRPGSAEVDELVVVSVRGDDAWVSRHRPDGSALDEGRRVYVPMFRSRYEAEFLPQSRMTVLSAGGEPEIYFVEAEKPANWIRRVDVGAAVGTEKVFMLGVADPAGKPKAVVTAGDSVYAVDAEGSYYTVSGGAFVPAAKPAPFYVAKPPTAQHGSAMIFPSPRGGDELLVVHQRARGLTRPADEEIIAAAERFLPPDDLAEARRDAEPSLGRPDAVRDRLIRQEAERKGVRREVTSIDEWRRVLPESYDASVSDLRATLHARLWSDLKFPREVPSALREYRDPEGLRRWLAEREVHPEVRFEVVRRGAVVRSFRVEAGFGASSASDVLRPSIEWRPGTEADVVVTTLSFAVAGGKAEPAFSVVRLGPGSR